MRRDLLAWLSRPDATRWLPRFFALLVIFGLNGSFCDPGPSIVPVKLRFQSVTVSTRRALPGQEIVVTWQYQAPERLREHGYRFLGLTVPNLAAPEVQLPRERNELRFPFKNAVTIELVARGQDEGEGDRVSFDVEFDEPFRMEALLSQESYGLESALEEGSAGYNLLGVPLGKPRRVRFQGLIAFYDPDAREICADRNGNGQIDAGECRSADPVAALCPDRNGNGRSEPAECGPNREIDSYAFDPGFLSLFPKGQPFRALTQSPRELADPGRPGGGYFPMLQGRDYPLLNAEFLSRPDPFDAGQTYGAHLARYGVTNADAVAFGGTLLYDGEPFVVRTDKGEEVPGFRAVPAYGAIFLAIILRSHTDGNAETKDPLLIADLQIGNAAKGLIPTLTTLTQVGLDRRLAGGATDYGEEPGLGLVQSGSIALARPGIVFTTLGGSPLKGYVRLEDLQWKVPFVSDRDLLPEVDCGDGRDNDLDAYADCADAACDGVRCGEGRICAQRRCVSN